MDELCIDIQKTLKGHGRAFTVTSQLTSAHGECTALFGSSGSGKTTILRMLAGLEKPDSGRIHFNNVTWFDSQKDIFVEPQKRHIGFVFQDFALFPSMTVEKNILYGLQDKTNKNVEYYLQTFGLLDFRERMPGTLSGGQKQKVALARACAQQPALLLLDEPLSSLDNAMRASLQDVLFHIKETLGITTVLVSHDIAEIFRLANKVYTLEKGAITSYGTPQHVFKGPGDKLHVKGKLLEKKTQGIMCIVTVAVGMDVSQLAISLKEAEELKPGDMICISVKAFNPQVSVMQ